MYAYYHKRTNEQFIADYERETEGFEIHAIGRMICGKSEGHSEECPEECTDASHVHEHSEGCYDSEAYFSWTTCHTCGSLLGGERTPCSLTNPGFQADGTRFPIVEVESCTDCVAYAANGDLPNP